MIRTILASAVAAVLSVGAASAATIDFGSLPAGDIDQNWGDVAGVLDVSYAMITGNPAINAPDNGDSPEIWTEGYMPWNTGALIGPGAGLYTVQVTLQALNGNLFTSFEMFMGVYTASVAGTLQSYSALAYDQAGNTLDSNTGGPGAGLALPFISAFSLSGVSKIVLQLGSDWDAGITSINYEVTPVPLPAGGLLLLGGLAGLAALRRRKSV